MSEPKKHKDAAVDDRAVQPSRRNFLKFGASGIAAATLSTWIPSDGMLQAAPVAPVLPVVEDRDAPAAGEHRIQLKVNGQVHTLNVPANAVLLDVLRDRLQLTGTKKGCDHGQCSSHVAGQRRRSTRACPTAWCSIRASITDHRRSTRTRMLHPVQCLLGNTMLSSVRWLPGTWADQQRSRDSSRIPPGPMSQREEAMMAIQEAALLKGVEVDCTKIHHPGTAWIGGRLAVVLASCMTPGLWSR